MSSSNARSKPSPKPKTSKANPKKRKRETIEDVKPVAQPPVQDKPQPVNHPGRKYVKGAKMTQDDIEMSSKLKDMLGGPKPISGYYYDEKTNHYFKIPRPGSVGYRQYLDLVESCKQKINAEKLAKISEVTQNKAKKLDSIHQHHLLSQVSIPSRSNIHSLTRQMKNSLISSSRIEDLTKQEWTIRKLKDVTICKILPSENPDIMYMVYKNGDIDAYCLKSRKTRPLCSAGTEVFSLELRPRPSSSFEYDSDPSDASLLWDKSVPTTYSVTTVGRGLTTPSIFAHVPGRLIPSQTSKYSIWSHCWIDYKSLVYTTDKSVLSWSLETFKSTTLGNYPSTVFCCTPHPSDKNLILLGTRSGELVQLDLRKNQFDLIRGPREIARPSSIFQTKFLKNEFHYLTNDTDGKINMYDSRMISKDSIMLWKYDSNPLGKQNHFEMDSDQQTLYCFGNTENNLYCWSMDRVQTSEAALIKKIEFEDSIQKISLAWNDRWLSTDKKCNERLSGIGLIHQNGIIVMSV